MSYSIASLLETLQWSLLHTELGAGFPLRNYVDNSLLDSADPRVLTSLGSGKCKTKGDRQVF